MLFRSLPKATIKTHIVEEKGKQYLEATADKFAMRVYFYTPQGWLVASSRVAFWKRAIFEPYSNYF